MLVLVAKIMEYLETGTTRKYIISQDQILLILLGSEKFIGNFHLLEIGF